MKWIDVPNFCDGDGDRCNAGEDANVHDHALDGGVKTTLVCGELFFNGIYLLILCPFRPPCPNDCCRSDDDANNAQGDVLV